MFNYSNFIRKFVNSFRVSKKTITYVFLVILSFNNTYASDEFTINKYLLTSDAFYKVCKPTYHFKDLSLDELRQQVTCMAVTWHLVNAAILSSSFFTGQDPDCEFKELGIYNLSLGNLEDLFLAYLKAHPELKKGNPNYLALNFVADRFPTTHPQCTMKKKV